MAKIVNFSHCSCYGTWDCIEDNNPEWEGSLEELIKMAKNMIDPAIDNRIIRKDDCDYECMLELYKEFLLFIEDEEKKNDRTN